MRITYLARTSLFLMTILYTGICTVMAQTVTNPPATNPQVSPKTPNQNDLDTYGMTGIDHYSGTAKISIPFYEINFKGVTIPVGIHYSSSGIKVNQRASDVGLGWNLSAGGSITRTKKGQADKTLGGTDWVIDRMVTGCNVGQPAILYEISRDYVNYDPEPDLFTYNFPGYSGEFYFVNGGIRTLEETDLRFEWEMRMGLLKRFIVTDPNGVRYYFGAPEDNEDAGFYEESSYRDVYSLDFGSASFCSPSTWPGYPKALLYTSVENLWAAGGAVAAMESEGIRNAWNLSKIVFPDNPDENVIRFSYRSEIYTGYTELNEKFHVKSNDINGHEWISRSFITPTVLGGVLSGISWPGGNIGFSYNGGRRDQFQFQNLPNQPSGIKALTVEAASLSAGVLKEVGVYGKDQVLQKKFILDHSYFNLGQGLLYERLMLKSVTEMGTDGRLNPPYEFFYNKSDSLPSILSDMQDYWGYYRKLPVLHKKPALVQPSSTIPLHVRTFPSRYSMVYYGPPVVYMNGLHGVDRSSNLNDAEIGVLSLMKVPTGALYCYQYELHRIRLFPTPTGGGPSYAPVVEGAGLRVKKITITTNYMISDTTALEEEYQYGMGHIFSVPQFTKTWYVNRFLNDVTRMTIFSNPVNNVKTSKGNLVAYENVTVKKRDQGTVSYTFSVNMSTSGHFHQPQASINLKNTYEDPEVCQYDPAMLGYVPADRKDFFPYPSGPTLNWADGLPLEETTRAENGKIAKKIVYKYSTFVSPRTYVGATVNVINDERFVDGLGVDISNVYNYTRYYYLIGRMPLAERIETLYDLSDSTKYTTNSIQYAFNENITGNKLPYMTTQLNSMGDAERQVYTYVSNAVLVDSSVYGGGDNDVIAYFAERNIKTPLVEQVEMLKAAGDTEYKVTGGTFNKYKVFDNNTANHVYPSEVYTLATNAALPDFVPAVMNLDNQVIDRDSRYVLNTTYEKYNIYGNLSQYKNRAKGRSSIKYDKAGIDAIAVFNNAATSHEALGNESGYLDFESNDFGSGAIEGNDYWDVSENVTSSPVAFTGKYAALVSSGKSLNRCFLPEDQLTRYKFSAWVKLKNTSPSGPAFLVIRSMPEGDDCNTDNDMDKEPDAARVKVDFSANDTVWTYVEAVIDMQKAKEITPAAILLLNCYVLNTMGEEFYIDNIRFQPIPSAVQSCTYDAGHRVTSISDEAGKTENYEYDSFGRLSMIRDTFKNIVKSFYYTYSNR